MKPDRTLGDVIEAQNRVIRHVIDFMERHTSLTRAERIVNGRHVKQPAMHGLRKMEAELRRAFDFTERHCNVCKRWLSDRHFHKHRHGRAGLQPHCKACARLARIYGGKDKIPAAVLRDFCS